MNGRVAKFLRTVSGFEPHADRTFKGGAVYEKVSQWAAESRKFGYFTRMVHGVKEYLKMRVWTTVESTDLRSLYKQLKKSWHKMSQVERTKERKKFTEQREGTGSRATVPGVAPTPLEQS